MAEAIDDIIAELETLCDDDLGTIFRIIVAKLDYDQLDAILDELEAEAGFLSRQ